LLTLDAAGDETWTQEIQTVDGELSEMVTYGSDEQPEWAALTEDDRVAADLLRRALPADLPVARRHHPTTLR